MTHTTRNAPTLAGCPTEPATTSIDTLSELVHTLNDSESQTASEFDVLTRSPNELAPKTDRKPLGYQRQRNESAPWPPLGKTGPGWQEPKPLPKRPTGRIFVGAILACFLGSIVWQVWTTFFSVVAYGIVEADVLKMVSPWEGKIAELHFREGQAVTKDQLLVTLDSSRLTLQLERLQEELQIESAKLNAERTRLRQEAHAHSAQYFQMWATLQKSNEELSRLQQELELVKSIDDPGVMSRQAFNRLVSSEAGQREFVTKMTDALEELRQRAQNNSADDHLIESLLSPIVARIEYLEGEIRRTKTEMRHGEIRAPHAGIVTRSLAVTGQTVSTSEMLLEIVKDDSLKIELFVPQSAIDRYEAGKEVTLAMHPNREPLKCTIVGSRNRFEAAPDSIRQYYRHSETLMPVILIPRNDVAAHSMYLGSVTKFTLLESLRGQ